MSLRSMHVYNHICFFFSRFRRFSNWLGRRMRTHRIWRSCLAGSSTQPSAQFLCPSGWHGSMETEEVNHVVRGGWWYKTPCYVYFWWEKSGRSQSMMRYFSIVFRFFKWTKLQLLSVSLMLPLWIFLSTEFLPTQFGVSRGCSTLMTHHLLLGVVHHLESMTKLQSG